MPLLLKLLQPRELQLQLQFLWLKLLLVSSVTVGFLDLTILHLQGLAITLAYHTSLLLIFYVVPAHSFGQYAVTVEMLPVHVYEQAFLGGVSIVKDL